MPFPRTRAAAPTPLRSPACSLWSPVPSVPIPALDLADPDTARARIAGCGTAGPAVAALSPEGSLLGFMGATVTEIPNVPGAPGARDRLPHHATDRTIPTHRARAVLRHLYGDLSRRLAEIGCSQHTVVVSARHHETVTHLMELGFGLDQLKGLRAPTPHTRPAPGPVPVRDRGRAATPADLPEILRLTLELQRFHTEPPVLRPFHLDFRALADDLRAAVTDPGRVVLVSEAPDQGCSQAGSAARVSRPHPPRLDGLFVVDPDSGFPDTMTIGIAVVDTRSRRRGVGTMLLSEALAQVAARGMRACGAEWTSVNLVSDAFWRGHGFVPARYTLTRHLDTRPGGPEPGTLALSGTDPRRPT